MDLDFSILTVDLPVYAISNFEIFTSKEKCLWGICQIPKKRVTADRLNVNGGRFVSYSCPIIPFPFVFISMPQGT